MRLRVNSPPCPLLAAPVENWTLVSVISAEFTAAALRECRLVHCWTVPAVVSMLRNSLLGQMLPQDGLHASSTVSALAVAAAPRAAPAARTAASPKARTP